MSPRIEQQHIIIGGPENNISSSAGRAETKRSPCAVHATRCHGAITYHQATDSTPRQQTMSNMSPPQKRRRHDNISSLTTVKPGQAQEGRAQQDNISSSQSDPAGTSPDHQRNNTSPSDQRHNISSSTKPTGIATIITTCHQPAQQAQPQRHNISSSKLSPAHPNHEPTHPHHTTTRHLYRAQHRSKYTPLPNPHTTPQSLQREKLRA